ncbi:hypothetical protein ABMA27_010368 [Loxostege sticticalis]|uniref:Reverse transcriptase domain-containing protein n=1 Tax=Loxostege sticticalis TaxID=481309 RepID=A0ABR3H5H8_LOXSC
MVSTEDVAKVIDRLDCNKSPGTDQIRVRDLKLIKNSISPVIAKFINMCLKKGVYPNELKKAIIRPIHKQGSHQEYTNYRPIAILNVLNKITEKLIVKQVSDPLKKNNIISDVQYGFRPNRSTDMALSKFTDDVNTALNEQKLVMTIFIDFKKACDTLDQDGLLQSMEEYGKRGPVNTWFRNYLKDRTLEVNISGTSSDVGRIKYGVPTGSVYGPVGYIIHVNGMTNVIKSSSTYMYADDTCLMYCDKGPKNVQKVMQKDLDNTIRWAHDNGIIINVSKTKCMLISSPYSHQKQVNIVIKGHTYDCLHSSGASGMDSCRCEQIEQVESYKYLGLTIDNKFSWNLHIDQVCKKLRSVLGKMYYLKYMTSRGILYMLYHALADSTIGYGLGSYGLTFPVHLNKIKALQIRLLKILACNKIKNECNKEYEKLFKICKIVPIDKKIKMTLVVEQFMKSEHKKEREYGYPTRQSRKRKYVVPKSKNYFGRRTRGWIVPTLHNELPPDLLGGVVSKNHLKNILKKHYLSLCP